MKPIVFALIVLILVTGCVRQQVPETVTITTQPETTVPVPEPQGAVSAQRIEGTKILITYGGGPDADQLLELETTVITDKGSVFIRSMGSRLDTTPVRIGGIDIFPGPFPDRVHILTVGYYTNGTHTDLLDTWI